MARGKMLTSFVRLAPPVLHTSYVANYPKFSIFCTKVGDGAAREKVYIFS